MPSWEPWQSVLLVMLETVYPNQSDQEYRVNEVAEGIPAAAAATKVGEETRDPGTRWATKRVRQRSAFDLCMMEDQASSPDSRTADTESFPFKKQRKRSERQSNAERGEAAISLKQGEARSRGQGKSSITVMPHYDLDRNGC